jgi:hypothetical protein
MDYTGPENHYMYVAAFDSLIVNQKKIKRASCSCTFSA